MRKISFGIPPVCKTYPVEADRNPYFHEFESHVNSSYTNVRACRLKFQSPYITGILTVNDQGKGAHVAGHINMEVRNRRSHYLYKGMVNYDNHTKGTFEADSHEGVRKIGPGGEFVSRMERDLAQMEAVVRTVLKENYEALRQANHGGEEMLEALRELAAKSGKLGKR